MLTVVKKLFNQSHRAISIFKFSHIDPQALSILVILSFFKEYCREVMLKLKIWGWRSSHLGNPKNPVVISVSIWISARLPSWYLSYSSLMWWIDKGCFLFAVVLPSSLWPASVTCFARGWSVGEGRHIFLCAQATPYTFVSKLDVEVQHFRHKIKYKVNISPGAGNGFIWFVSTHALHSKNAPWYFFTVLGAISLIRMFSNSSASILNCGFWWCWSFFTGSSGSARQQQTVFFYHY